MKHQVKEVAFLLNRGKTAVAAFMLLMLIIPVATPLATAGDSASARSGANFVVQDVTFDGAGSIVNGTTTHLQNATHSVHVEVQNIGGSAGVADVNLYHKGSLTSTKVLLDSVTTELVGAQNYANTVLFTFVASPGLSQSLFVEAYTTQATDEMEIRFDCQSNPRYLEGVVGQDTVDEPLAGQDEITIPGVTVADPHIYTVDVTNTGVHAIDASFQVYFEDPSDSTNNRTFDTGSQLLQPGSTHVPASEITLSVAINENLDASIIWEMTAYVVFTYGASTWEVNKTIKTVDARFSEYSATLDRPANRTVQPGISTDLNFLLTNTGTATDKYTIQVSSIANWVDNSINGDETGVIVKDQSEVVTVSVAVPSNAARTDADIITLELTSIGASPYKLTAKVRVSAGTISSADLETPATPQVVVPGNETSIVVNITNTGNQRSSFDLQAGFSNPSSRWSANLGVTSTGTLDQDEKASFSVDIMVPRLQMPLDAADFNREGDTMDIWIQATPTNGGTPVMATTTLFVAPVIVVDPGLIEEVIDLEVADVIASKNGIPVEINKELNFEVRHNLNTLLIPTINASVSNGTKVFTPANSGGFAETNRWNTSVTNETLEPIALGATVAGLLTIEGPDNNEYPLAGTIVIPVVASVNRLGIPPHIEIPPVSRNITINIPSVQGADIVDKGPFTDLSLTEVNTLPLMLNNTGNDLSSYRLSVLDDLPDGWVASISTNGGNSDTILDLESDFADQPLEGNSHLREFDLIVTIDDRTAAYTTRDINIKVEDALTGILIDVIPVTVEIGPFVNASISPATQVVDINTLVDERPLARVFLSNTGNIPTTYSLSLDDSLAGEVTFALETPNEILVGAGFTESIKIRLIASDDAISDAGYSATLRVETDDNQVFTAEIIANVSEQRNLIIEAPVQIAVLPGEERVIDYTVTNEGNLAEVVDVQLAVVEAEWLVVPTSQQMVLDIGETTQASVTVTVPELGDGIYLDDGKVYDLTISLVDETGVVEGLRTVQMSISPMFILDVVEWQDTMEYHAQWNRTFMATVANTGNRDVTVDLTANIFNPGTEVDSLKWEFTQLPPQSLFLPVNTNISFSFMVSSIDATPVLSDQAQLSIHLLPQQTDVSGEGYLNSTLVMSRFFASSDFNLQPDDREGPYPFDITYSHIPVGNSDTAIYELELCAAQRIYNSNEVSESPTDYVWNFSYQGNENQIALSIPPADCGAGSAGPEHRITLPQREAWDTGNPITIQVTPPARALAGDGWDLTFRLFEKDNYQTFNQSTFTFKLDTYADPSITRLWISDGNLEEGTDAIITARIRNEGTAEAMAFTVSLKCSGSTIHTADHLIEGLENNSVREVSWDVTSDTIDWWRQSIDGTCVAEIVDIDPISGVKNVKSNDRYVYKDEVYSWSPGQSSSFVAFIIFGLLALVLARLNGQNEKFRLFATYAGVLAFGFAFHLFNIIYWGPAVLLVSALYIWRMTWMSTDEFRLIHEDYQRARKGVSTLYADHFQALADSRRQLRIILALPVFGLLGVVLGIPPQIDTSQENLLTIAAYVGILAVGVSILIKRADSLYGSLYGRLTDVEVKATRIERDLSDPARLLHELANDGINLDAIFDDLQARGDLVNDEEVGDDV